MMPVGNLAKMVVANTLRSPRHFVLSAFGIVIGIATFVVFLGSTEQVAAVLEKIFPVEEVEVVPPHVTGVAMDTKRLDDSTVQTIKDRNEAARVLPRMSLAFPASGAGTFNGARALWAVDRTVIDGAVNAWGKVTLVSAWLSGLTDRAIVDGVVNLVGWIVQESSHAFRRVQTGLVQNYALLMLFGIFAFVSVYLFVRQP